MTNDQMAYRVARFLSSMQIKLQEAFKKSRKTEEQLAEIMGVDVGEARRRLSGSSELTAKELAELAFALNKDAVFVLQDPSGDK